MSTEPKKIEERRKAEGGMRIAVIDDNQNQLSFFKAVFGKAFWRETDKVDTYLYPDMSEELKKKADQYDIIVVDYLLGGVNGANFGRSLFNQNCPAKIVVFSASEKTDLTKLNYYFEKADLAKHPRKLLSLPNSEIGQAVEMAYLAGRDIVLG